MGDLPALTGPELIKFLKKDGWEEAGKRTHGIALKKRYGDQCRITIIPTKTDSLPTGTLNAILGSKQTGLGAKGLRKLLQKK